VIGKEKELSVPPQSPGIAVDYIWRNGRFEIVDLINNQTTIEKMIEIGVEIFETKE